MNGTKVHVALLRGINLGGANRLAMRDLVAIFDELGARDVRTYIQSGNVVFRASPDEASCLPERVSARIAERFGYRVPVVLRTGSELGAIARNNPFLQRGEDAKHCHVAFLAHEPARDAVAALDPARSPPDEFEVRGREVYLLYPNGVARSKLTNAYLDATLRTTSTVRNWRTVLELARLSAD